LSGTGMGQHTHCVGCGHQGFSIHMSSFGCNISDTNSATICYYNGNNINYATYCALNLCTTGVVFGSTYALCV